MPKGKTRLFLVRGLIAAGILGVLLFTLYKVAFDPYRGSAKDLEPTLALTESMPAGEALEDLDYIRQKIMERHPAAMAGLPPAMAEAYAEEKAWLLGREEVTSAELWRSAARFLESLGDAHTRAVHYAETVPSLPVIFQFRDGELLASGSGLTLEPVRLISGVPVAELQDRFARHYSHELEGYLRFMFARSISQQNYQMLLDLPLEEPSLTLADDREISLAWQESPPAEEADRSFVRYSFDEELSLAVFTLDSCRMNEEYRETLKEFFWEVRDRGIRNVAVDLRQNSGGNSAVAGEFLRYIDTPELSHGGTRTRMGPILFTNKAFTEKNRIIAEFKYQGPVYILTSPVTFSAAVDFAATFSDNSLAQVVGRIPGNMPASYGDIINFQTPHAKLYFSVSYKYFMRSQEALNSEPLIPDLDVPEGEALDAVKRLIRQGSRR